MRSCGASPVPPHKGPAPGGLGRWAERARRGLRRLGPQDVGREAPRPSLLPIIWLFRSLVRDCAGGLGPRCFSERMSRSQRCVARADSACPGGLSLVRRSGGLWMGSSVPGGWGCCSWHPHHALPEAFPRGLGVMSWAGRHPEPAPGVSGVISSPHSWFRLFSRQTWGRCPCGRPTWWLARPPLLRGTQCLPLPRPWERLLPSPGRSGSRR